MSEHAPTSDTHDPTDFVRTRRARTEADREYNDALTALDRAIQTVRDWPQAPPAYDESQLANLNGRWHLLSLRPADGGGFWRRVRAQAWSMVAPLFARQQDFNATVVEHLNRNVASHREAAKALEETLALVREEFSRLVSFESRVVQYAQTITAFVDTRDRSVEAFPHEVMTLTNALGSEMQLRWESLGARDRRFESEINEVRTTLGVAHRAILTLKRELELAATPPGPTTAAVPAVPAAGSAAPTRAALNAYKYVGFEDQFRGTPADIRERMASYVSDFAGCSDVLDMGCGRGEFLDLLRESGISARGVDLNDEMVGICRDRGLDATTMDALSYLEGQPNGSLGGLFGAQIVEHLEPDYLLRLLETAYHKLRPGSVVVLETVNPACWFAFFSSYIRDITHVRPLHPDTLRYLVLASGFQMADVRYAAPFPDASKLQPVTVPGDSPFAQGAAVLNENVSKLNGLLFTFLDYAVIARRI